MFEFALLYDLANYSELERMRDDLARDNITRDSLADGLVKLASKYGDLLPEALQVLHDLYERLTGLSFPAQQQVTALQPSEQTQ